MPQPPSEGLSVEFRVRYSETDQMGVVYHAEYLVWCEVGRTEFIRALGLPYAQLEARGTGLAVTEATLRYAAPARYDDRIRVVTFLRGVRSRSLTFDYHITNADTGNRLATARTTLVALDREGRLTAIPADVRTILRQAVRHDED